MTKGAIVTLSVRRGFHAACCLAKRVRQVDVSLSHDGLVEGRKLANHLRHGLLQQVLLFALLYVLLTARSHSEIQLEGQGISISCF